MRIRLLTFITIILCPLLTHAEDRSEELFSLLTRISPETLAEMRSADMPSIFYISSPASARQFYPEGMDAYYRSASKVFMLSERADLGVGFILAQDIETVLTFESEPQRFEMILELKPGKVASVQSTLLDMGYTVQERFGVSTYVKGDTDFEYDLKSRNPLDPFSGLAGYSARVVFQDDIILSARSWPHIQLLSNFSAPNPIWEPLADAVDTLGLDDSVLLQAQVFLSRYNNLIDIPLWNIAMVADLSDGTTDTTMALFVYDTKRDAELAVAHLEEGWSKPIPIRPHINTSLASITGSNQPILTVLGEGPYVTALSLHAPVALDDFQKPYNRSFRSIIGLLYEVQD